MTRRSNLTGYAVLVSTLLALLASTTWIAASARQAAQQGRAQLAECQQLATRMEALRSAPDRAEEVSRGHEELAQQIEEWSRSAKIAPQQIVSVSPISPRRVADSDYQQVGAEVDLSAVTLRQLAALADEIALADRQLSVSGLRLQPPRDQSTDGSTDEHWNAEIALTYLLYSPRSSSR